MNQGQKLLLASGALGASAVYSWMTSGARADTRGFLTVWIPLGIAAFVIFGAITKK